MIITCTRRLTFCAGHRVMGHEGKCRNMHGHNYVAELTAQGAMIPLDAIGRVIDFSVLKERVGGWIEENWDHGFIVNVKDEEVIATLRHTRGKMFLLPENPTAEEMAHYLLTIVCPQELNDTGVEVVRIRLYETENCWAEVTL